MSELLQVEGLSVRYPGGGLLRRREGRTAVHDVGFTVAAGRTFGLVGESGSGKSTTGRAVLRLVEPSAGRIVFDGREVTAFGRRTPASYRRDVQVVFQNPISALNPSMTVEELLAEPVRVHRAANRAETDAAVAELLEQVGLAAYHRRRLPFELSGGQRQRVAIARALAVRPRLLVCDEPVSALDVSTQSQVVNLFMDLQAELGIAYIFIAHDLSVVRHVSDDVGVMFAGRLVESGPADRVYDAPAHPYTRALLGAAPVPSPARQRAARERRRALLRSADAPAPAGGCPFQNRCPSVMDVCRTLTPSPVPVAAGGTVACHLEQPLRSLDAQLT
ncbi:oligopeptide/dipeptide ABC transporter ATP-binding protein [Streptosporangium sp. NPDC051022]|uniref:ABC transporter ATP-binding protein n=1 Tax=Streptosporangium sp. NPDC051022 TaxID=3155752 RepID=UPI00341D5FB1